MKNKKIIAILTATICCACLVSYTIGPFICMAEDNSVANIINNVPSNITFTGKYNELVQMTDEEISEKYGLSEFSFGDESIPDETKFAAYLNKVPDWYIGDNYESESYSA